MKKYLLLVLPLFIAACGPTYRDTLETKLQGKSEQEKRVALAQECATEIKNGLKPEEPANVRHFQRIKQICEEMTGQKVDVKLPAVDKL